jgi:hypothetical protein
LPIVVKHSIEIRVRNVDFVRVNAHYWAL